MGVTFECIKETIAGSLGEKHDSQHCEFELDDDIIDTTIPFMK